MNPRNVLQLLVVVGFQPAAARAVETRPNILFIAVDDLRPELGCYGVKEIKTPNFDRLAASGVTFTRAYCQQAVCNPSRVSLMTGLRPDSTKVWDLVTEMRTTIPDVVTLPQHFRKSGYRAVAYGKIYHNIFPDAASWDEPTHDPGDVVHFSQENRARLATFRKQMLADGKSPEAARKMRGPATEIQDQPDDKNFDGKQTADALAKMGELAAGKQPFFLAVGYIRPHLPLIVPKKYWDLYDRASIPLATNPHMPKDAPAVAFGDLSMGGTYELRHYMSLVKAPSPFVRPLPEADQRELKHGYYAAVSFIDAQVGRLLDGLEERGLAQNTIVVLWGDHGWKLGEHGGWCKQTNYEIDTRAPLMIRAPGAKANGQRTAALAEFIDIYPTLCELAGLPLPASLEGTSLVPVLADASATVNDAAFSQFPRRHQGRDHMGYAMRTDRYRYIEWLDKATGRIAARELYDHESDPAENENIAGHPEQSGVIAALNLQLWKSLPRPNFAPLPEELGHWSPVVRAAAIGRAAKAGPAALPALLAALESDNTGLRHSAANVIAILAKAAPSKDTPDWQAVTTKLIAMVSNDPDFWTRSEAAAALKHLPSQAAASALIRAARDPDPWVVAAAVDAIGTLPLELFDRQEYRTTAVLSLAAPRSATRSSGVKMIAALGPEGMQVLPDVEASVATYSRDSMFADRPRIDAIEWIARHDRHKAAALANGMLLEERWGAQGRARRLVPFLQSLGRDAAPAAEGLKRAATDKRNVRMAGIAARILKSLAP